MERIKKGERKKKICIIAIRGIFQASASSVTPGKIIIKKKRGGIVKWHRKQHEKKKRKNVQDNFQVRSISVRDLSSPDRLFK